MHSLSFVSAMYFGFLRMLIPPHPISPAVTIPTITPIIEIAINNEMTLTILVPPNMVAPAMTIPVITLPVTIANIDNHIGRDRGSAEYIGLHMINACLTTLQLLVFSSEAPVLIKLMENKVYSKMLFVGAFRQF